MSSVYNLENQIKIFRTQGYFQCDIFKRFLCIFKFLFLNSMQIRVLKMDYWTLLNEIQIAIIGLLISTDHSLNPQKFIWFQFDFFRYPDFYSSWYLGRQTKLLSF